MPDISKITLPSGTTYDIKDAVARATAAGAISIIGTTTTPLTDEATTNPITINGQSYTAISGNAVFYQKKEFVFDGTKWHEFGDMSGLGALATKDSVSFNNNQVTGTVSKPNFSGKESSVTITATVSASGNYQPGGDVSKPSFTGASMTSTGNYKPAGEVTVTTKTTSDKATTVSAASSGTITYTPDGDIEPPTISVKTAGSTTTIKNPTSQTVAKTVVAAAPGATAPTNPVTYYSVSGETLSLYQLGYTTGASITTSNVTVKTDDAAYEASAPEFIGAGVRLVTGSIPVPDTYDATFDGTTTTISVSGTTTGDVSKPSFTGTKVSLTGTTTADGEISQPTFTPDTKTITAS